MVELSWIGASVLPWLPEDGMLEGGMLEGDMSEDGIVVDGMVWPDVEGVV